MKYCLAVFICVAAFSPQLKAQINTYSNQGSAVKPFGEAINQATFLYETKYNPQLIGNYYIEKDWQKADVVFIYDSLLVKDLQIKANVWNNTIEILVDNEIKVLNADQLLSFTTKETNEVFISHITINVSEPKGFFKLLYNKKSAILCHYSTIVKEGNYNIALNVGNKDNKISIVKNYYAFIDSELIKLPKNRKNLLKQFQGNKLVRDFIRKEKIRPSRETDLIQMINYYDKIMSK
ncbi:MAG: hypothetical protein K9H64_15065 [Bacteroidales bacterium]|nr:hypothetical protein [Bacteroidales bacterium]MCF8457308.1 hypothetical protein [Bacteroidales bacterium]